MPDQDYSHIEDTDTVFIKDPNDDSVGSCLGAAFRKVYAPQGYTQVDQAAWEAHMAVLNDEREKFVPSGRLAPLPDGEPEAQDIINAERAADTGGSTASISDAAASAGVTLPKAPNLAKRGRHAGEG